MLSHLSWSFEALLPFPSDQCQHYIYENIRKEPSRNQKIKEKLSLFPYLIDSGPSWARTSSICIYRLAAPKTKQISFAFALVRQRLLYNANSSVRAQWLDAGYMDCSLTLAGRLLWLTRWWSQTTNSSMQASVLVLSAWYSVSITSGRPGPLPTRSILNDTVYRNINVMSKNLFLHKKYIMENWLISLLTLILPIH